MQHVSSDPPVSGNPENMKTRYIYKQPI